MAADAYLREAAARVRDAIGDLHADIQHVQGEAYRAEAQLHNDLLHTENEISELKIESRAMPDAGQKAAVEVHIRQLEAEVSKKKAEVAKLGNEAAREVQAKNNLLNSLEGTASQLESKAASAR